MKILVYNVQMASTWYARNGQDIRSRVIVEKIIKERAKFDCIVLCEVFQNAALAYMVKYLQPHFPHFTRLPKKAFTVVSGGIVFMSKKPFVSSDYMHYTNAVREERLASKGALWIKFKSYSIIATHPQSWDREESTRLQQFQSVLKWIKDYKKPIIIVGDLNVDLFNPPETFKRMVEQLPTVTSQLQFSQSQMNAMRGNDGSATKNDCGEQYYCNVCDSTPNNDSMCKMVCAEKPVEPTFCPCCPDQLIDYGFIPKDHPKAKRLEMQVLAWKADRHMVFQTWMLGQFTMPKLRTTDMSDHYPVLINWKY